MANASLSKLQDRVGFAAIKNKLDYPEFFDIRIQKIKKDLLSIEQQYFSKSLNKFMLFYLFL